MEEVTEKPNDQITFKFESGTTIEEIHAYINNLRESLKGKMTDAAIEELVQSLLTSLGGSVNDLHMMCDGCGKEISKEEKAQLNGNTSFACRVCPMKYDLCPACQEEEGTSTCPEGFGCGGMQVAEKTVFIPKENREVPQVYSAFGKTFRVTPGNTFTVETQGLIQDLKSCVLKAASAIYIEEKDFPLEVLRDLWLYFRSINPTSLEKYGPPLTKIDNLGHLKLYTVYREFEPLFLEFITMDDKTDPNSPLFLRMIYPDHSEFIVWRLKTEDQKKHGVKFLTYTLSGLKDEEKTNMPCEPFREKLKEITGRSLEELVLTGQLITNLIMAESEKV